MNQQEIQEAAKNWVEENGIFGPCAESFEAGANFYASSIQKKLETIKDALQNCQESINWLVDHGKFLTFEHEHLCSLSGNSKNEIESALETLNKLIQK